jgi:LasA protease
MEKRLLPSSLQPMLQHSMRCSAVIAAAAIFLTGCQAAQSSATPDALVKPWIGYIQPDDQTTLPTSTPIALHEQPIATMPLQPVAGTPTPDALRPPPPLRTEEETYYVQPGDSLNSIAGNFGVSAIYIARANSILNPDLLGIGQRLIIPAPKPQAPGPSLKLIPDSELVYGPASVYFDLFTEINGRGGYLSQYVGEVDGEQRSGAAIVQLVAERYSVNPQLLLALLEYRSGWLTQVSPSASTLVYPMGYAVYNWEGLFSQLSWAADQLNLGFYRWRAGWSGPYLLADGSVVPPGPGINAGTAAIQTLFAQTSDIATWRTQLGETGFAAVLGALYGDPFTRRVEPLLPADLEQPNLLLPFEPGSTWSFTGGPHSAWGDWAGWAALDFAPPGFAYGCVQSDEWAVAAADGLIVRAENGEVLLDLDGDGYEQTGWVLLYMHVESRDRVAPGIIVKAGEHIGHPSCEGGVTTGTHLHLARKYNGEWIPADGEIPFVLDGWVSIGTGLPYDGYLQRGGVTLEACACRDDSNQITR